MTFSQALEVTLPSDWRTTPRPGRLLIEQMSQPHFGLLHAFYAIVGGFAFVDTTLSGVVVTVVSIKCETAHNRVECMDKAKVWLRRLLYEQPY